MKLKKILNIAFLFYGILILVGLVLLVVFSGYVKSFNPSGGGGLALLILFGILGLGVVSLVGAIAYGVIGWLITLFFAAAVERLGPHAQKRLFIGFLLFTIISTISYTVLQHYFDQESETSKHKPQINEMDAQVAEVKELIQICLIQKGWILGKWKTPGSSSEIYFEFKDNYVVRYSEEKGWQNEGSWQLDCSDMMLMLERANDDSIKERNTFKLSHVGPTYLHLLKNTETPAIIFMRVHESDK